MRQAEEGDIGIQSQLPTTADPPHYDTQPALEQNVKLKNIMYIKGVC